MSPTKKDGELDGAQIEDERWFGSLSGALVPYSAGEHGTLLHRRVAELLSPIAAKVVAGVFAEARAEAASLEQTLDLAQKRFTQLYTCRLAEAAFIRRKLAESVAEAKAWRARAPASGVSSPPDLTAGAHALAGGFPSPSESATAVPAVPRPATPVN